MYYVYNEKEQYELLQAQYRLNELLGELPRFLTVQGI